MKYTVMMASDGMIYIPSFVKIESGFQVILSYYIDKLKCCSVGITNGKDL
jgi:hypothetical protein